MLTALQLGNFKSWREVNAPLAPITGFFGTNSSGKSSLLQAILLLKQSLENPDAQQVIDLGSEQSLVNLGNFQDIIWQKKNLIVRLGLEVVSRRTLRFREKQTGLPAKTKILSFTANLFLDENKTVKVANFCYRFGTENRIIDYSNSLFTVSGFNNDTNKYIETLEFALEKDSQGNRKYYRFPKFVIEKRIGGFEYDLWELEDNFEAALSRTHYLGPLRDPPRYAHAWSSSDPSNVGEQGENTIAALIAMRSAKIKVGEVLFEEYIALKLKQLNLIDSFRLEELREGTNFFRVLVRKTPESPEVSLTDVGFGVSQVLPVLVLCYYVPEGSTVILEHPELHLHPSAQSGLADVFIDAYQKRGVQIIIESHSEHLLRRLQRRIAEEQIATTDVNLYFCSLEHGESKLEALQLDEYGNIHNYPKDFFGDRFEEMAAMTEAGIARREKLALEAQ